MAFLVRCPHSRCRRPKRVDPPLEHEDHAIAWCLACRIMFHAWVADGVPLAIELPPELR